MPFEVPPLAVVPTVDDVQLGLLELVALGDAQGRVHDFVIASAFVDHDAVSAATATAVARRRLSELLGDDDAAAVRDRLVDCVERNEAQSFSVLTPGSSWAIRAIPTAPGRIVAVWADLTELRTHRRSLLRDETDAELVMALSESLVAIIDADGVCTDAWPGTGVPGLTRHELVGRPLASALGFDPLSTAAGAQGTSVVVRPLADGRRIVTIAPLSPEAVALRSARIELSRLRAMLAATAVGVAVFEAVRDVTGALVDFVCTDVSNVGSSMLDDVEIGVRLTERHPEVRANGTFASYQRVADDGIPAEHAPVRVRHRHGDRTYTTTVTRHLDGVVITWRDEVDDAPPGGAPASQGSPVGGPAYVLSARHAAILTLIADGASTEEIARTVHLSPFTVRNEVRRILARLGARSRAEAIATALRHGLIPAKKAPTADP